MQAFPADIDAPDASWLEHALAKWGNDVKIEDLLVRKVDRGTGTKVLVSATYAQASEPDGPPPELCIKAGGFEGDMAGFNLAVAFQREADFFEHLAPSLELALPRCWYAATDVEGGRGIIVMDDLAAAGCRFGEPTEPWKPDLVARGLEVLAKLHAATRGARPADHAWIGRAIPIREVGKVMIDAPYWEAHFASEAAPPMPDDLLDRACVQRAFLRMWELQDQEPTCVLHGDPHLGNTYVVPDGAPAFLDWQGTCIAPALDDATYFIAGALTTQDRRAHERDMLNHYLGALAAAGGERLSPDHAWLQYRRNQLHGLLWATTSPRMQPIERIHAMAQRHIAAIEDLETLAALAEGAST